MNLYRSFGDLMEVYVYEERTHPESHWHQDNADGPPAPVSNMAVNPRSESVDSGVETASCETPIPTSGNFLSTDNTEIEIFQLPRDRFSPASTSQSPVLTSSLPSSSSSSPNMCSSRAEKEPTPLNLKGEPELQRTDSKRWKQVYEVLSHQPKSSSLPKQHTSDLKRCIRFASFNMRRRFDPSVPSGNVSETQREPLSVGSVEQISQGSGMFEGKELSPGLCYLEWVCQKMELYAKQKMQNQELQTETVALQENEEQKNNSADSQEDQPSLENAKQVPSEPPQQKSRHFRQRSASDTTFSKLHLKKLNRNSRGQQLSTNNLREIEEEDTTQMDSKKEESNRRSLIQRLKIGSLRRAESAASDIRSQQMQSSEKLSTRRRFSQLFRRSKKVSPN
ncbi:uncharacterized protein si:dkey-106l3.7 [Cyprinodon tularosa]|uniref:uncharacterized protein si:dkey-106l3.7 n=1 Tax=Cyprinodon tularosa TaxID=77115 RepID=UPI0018E25C42|nr:uncharacterized protein si:dkey-106l3.7 [Cyprinodon tularosa]